MDSATWGFIGTIVGAVVGAATSLLTTLINSRHAVRLQEKMDILKKSERSREFQMNNLLELQDSLSQHMRLVGRAHIEDLESYKKGRNGERSNLLSEELNQELALSNRKLYILTERITDDELRSNLKELHQKMNKILFAKSETESRDTLQTAVTNYEQFMAQLGIVLRKNY